MFQSPPSAGDIVTLPDIFQASKETLHPVSAPYVAVHTPLDDGIQVTSGDDTSAPNAVTASRLNRIVLVSSATVAYSSAANDKHIFPCAVLYEADIVSGTRPNEFSMKLCMTLEYESSFPQEGMVVWVKKHQQFINDEGESELLLVETSFQDYVAGQWVPITTDIRYVEEAEAVVQAVITSESGQTAGRITTSGAIEDAKLGPVGERGRIILTYLCSKLYSYSEMNIGSGTDSRVLVPLGLQIPWAKFDSPANNCRFRAVVRAPAGSLQLDPHTHILAYQDLARSLSATFKEQAVVLPVQEGEGAQRRWEFSCHSLPPKSTMVLAWLSTPNPDADWEHLHLQNGAPSKGTQANLLGVDQETEKLLRISLPGGQRGHLVRCLVKTDAPKRSPDSIHVHTDIIISDASGSTGMKAWCSGQSGSVTVRACFNKHTERRMLKRLEAIPILRNAGVLLDRDHWHQIIVVFDHGVKAEFRIETKVQDLDAATVSHLLVVLTQVGDVNASMGELNRLGKKSVYDSWNNALLQLRGVVAGGATSFIAGTQRAKNMYKDTAKRIAGMECSKAARTAYVNFDTDGGNNGGPCYDAITELVLESDVVQGHVLGVGAWVDQDCASKVAKILRGSATLAMDFPDDAQSDVLFRQDLSRWVKTLRTVPLNMTISAGSTYWKARHGERFENGVECLFACGDSLRFGAPDISDAHCAKAVLHGMKAGESATLYLLSRWPLDELANKLEVLADGLPASVTVGSENLDGIALGHQWLSVLGTGTLRGLATNTSTACSRLRNRLEDELSFTWNLPTKSGSTAALGRAKTDHRPAVPKEKQPQEPEPPVLAKPPQESAGCSRRSLFAASCTQALPGGGAMCAPPQPTGFGALPLSCPPSAQATGNLFGGISGGGVWGGNTGGGGLFGANTRGGGVFGANTGGGASFGASTGVGFSGRGSFGSGGFPTTNGPAIPSTLLSSSDYMCWGAPNLEPLLSSIQRLRYLARSTMEGKQSQSTNVPHAEDPLIVQLLGKHDPTQNNAVSQVVHHGFVCDASNANPIVGIRFKSAMAADHDISEHCRRFGNFAGQSGFRPIPDPATAMRSGLASVLTWWRLVWKPEHESIFAAAGVNLECLQVGQLCQGILNIPDPPANKP